MLKKTCSTQWKKTVFVLQKANGLLLADRYVRTDVNTDDIFQAKWFSSRNYAAFVRDQLGVDYQLVETVVIREGLFYRIKSASPEDTSYGASSK